MKGETEREDSSSKLKKYLPLFLLILILILILFILIFIIFNHYNHSKHRLKKGYHLNNYMYTEINTVKKLSKTGISQTHQQILSKQEEYLTYPNKETGSFFVVTNLGGKRYECKGTCYCLERKEEDKRRSSTVLISRGLAIIFSAFSVHMAANIAKEAFKDQCVQELTDCPYTQIKKIETDEWEIPILDTDDDTLDDPEEYYRIEHEMGDCSELEMPEIDPNAPEKLVRCHGKCMKNKGYLKTLHVVNPKIDFEAAGKRRYGNCEDLTIDREINLNDPLVLPFLHNEMTIEEFFSIEHLHPFCEDETNLYFRPTNPEFDLTDTKYEEEMRQLEEMMENEDEKAPYCIGIFFSFELEDHVQCIPV